MMDHQAGACMHTGIERGISEQVHVYTMPTFMTTPTDQQKQPKTRIDYNLIQCVPE